jgi:hypothetical protein
VGRDAVPDALWDTAAPTSFSRRAAPGYDVVIFGANHKTGQQGDTEACYRRLKSVSRTHSLRRL